MAPLGGHWSARLSKGHWLVSCCHSRCVLQLLPTLTLLSLLLFLVARTARFCYQITWMSDRNLPDVVLRLPRPQNGSKTSSLSCYGLNFPTHRENLGDAEIVLDLNNQPDAVGAQLVDISVSPKDEKIAYAYGTDRYFLLLTFAIRSLVEEGPHNVLTQVLHCLQLGWIFRKVHL